MIRHSKQLPKPPFSAMKIKNKGKVHPSPSSSSSSSSSSSDDVVLSVLQLLPAAILALASVLSLDDREVLAYMITRSMKTAPSSPSSSSKPQDSKKKSSKKLTSKNNKNHQFDCECFDCYRSYWFRWDSSPNRELIHQAIEAFEDHLAHGEKPKKSAGRGKRRDKTGRLKSAENSSKDEAITVAVAAPAEEEESVNAEVMSSVPEVVLPVCEAVSERGEELRVEEEEAVEVKEEEATAEDVALIVRAAAVSDHKGLARKVLPDVLGLFNSRLWNLWSPNA